VSILGVLEAAKSFGPGPSGEVAFHLVNLCAIRAKCGSGPGMLQEDIERTIVHSVR